MRDSYRCHGTYLSDKRTVNCLQLKASSHSGSASSSQRFHNPIPFINQSPELMNESQTELRSLTERTPDPLPSLHPPFNLIRQIWLLVSSLTLS